MQLALQRAARLDRSRSLEPQRVVVDGLLIHWRYAASMVSLRPNVVALQPNATLEMLLDSLKS
jgi:hypothetical protein